MPLPNRPSNESPACSNTRSLAAISRDITNGQTSERKIEIMKKEYSSFICEHTAEYVLVPKLTKILKLKFDVVIPIFPWMTREGNNLSKHIHSHDSFKIVGFYPRRPKINLKDNKIIIKINNEFIEGAEVALKINIPMLAGCPLAKSLWELDDNTKCIWIKLTDKTKHHYEIEVNIEKTTEFKILDNKNILGSENEILDYVISTSKTHNFETLIQGIQNIRAHSSTVYFMGFGSYKPIYFLLKDN